MDLHGEIRSREACIKSTRLAMELARRHGTRLHVLHISTAGELALFEQGPLIRADGSRKQITAETCVHFLRFARGDYARQLDVLYAHFPRDQVLLLRSEHLRSDPEACVGDACSFLGVAPPAAGTAYEPVFVGDYRPASPGSPGTRLLRWLMRRELRDMRERYGIAFD